MSFSAVIFDWRGTLVTTLSWEQWIREALLLAGRPESPEPVMAALEATDPGEARLDAPGVDCDAEVHRQTYFGVFEDAGLDSELAGALYAVESDYRHNLFAADVPEVLRGLKNAGVRVVVLSDVHFDLRPAFAEAGLDGLVDAFVLSFEQGVQKPDPAIFTAALTATGVDAGRALMVGDRSGPDGAAVEHGITTLLLPPLRHVEDRRLHHVRKLAQG